MKLLSNSKAPLRRIVRKALSPGALLICHLTQFVMGAEAAEGPIQIELFEQFASFLNRDHPGNRIGYRFHEHTPLTWGEVPKAAAASNANVVSAAVEQVEMKPGVRTFRRRVTEKGWIPQDWMFYLTPVADGIELLLVVQTGDVGLPEFYGIQQCFRLTGVANQASWRHKYALTPAFSEFDLWKDATNETDLPSLTWVLRGGSLHQLPAVKATVGCCTPLGQTMDLKRSDGHLDTLQTVGPYEARMLWKSDDGLILRTSLDQKWSTGMYWEGTTHVSDHHPADCLHAIVNIGGVAPNSQRTLRGKIYWLRGSGKTLVEHWRRDFPDAQLPAINGDRP